MPAAAVRVVAIVALLAGVAGCDRAFKATAEERVGYLRELVRARTVSRDTLPIDGCSINPFMDGVPAWRDSLVAAERVMIVDDATCPAEIKPLPGRFVLTGWYRNWSGEYIIRGSTYPWDQGYRFTDGVYVGREVMQDQAAYVGIAEKRARRKTTDSLSDAMQRRDSSRRGGTVVDSPADARSAAPSAKTRDSSRRN